MHENRFNEYRIPSGMLIVFLEKALTLIHMETHLDDVSHSDLLHSTSFLLLLSVLSFPCLLLTRYKAIAPSY